LSLTTFPRPGDLEFVPLAIEPTDNGVIGRFTLEPKLARPDGALFGGTAIAASTTLMETATNAPALWITTQFVSSAVIGEELTLEANVVARGKRINQVQVNGRVGAKLVFTSIGSSALGREGGLDGQFLRMPDVGTPADAAPFQPGPRGMVDPESSFNRVSQFRQTALADAEKRTDGSMALWARTREGGLTPATISYLADMAPIAVARGAGKLGGGTSLDNSMRFGPDPSGGEWVLLEMHGHLALGGYGHASVHVWSEDGTLLAYGGQTANMRHVWDAG
jgi:acyl-CoA thioesterase